MLSIYDAHSHLQYKPAVLKARSIYLLHPGKDLKYTSEKLRNDKDIVLKAVKQDGTVLQFASKKLRNNETVVFEVIRQNRQSLEYASKSLKNDKEFAWQCSLQSIDGVIADAKKWCAEHNTPSSGKMELER